MYARPLWDWCTELLMDPNIVPQFHWDAEKHFKYNGVTFERFIDEPWTADAWWELQVRVTVQLEVISLYILTSPSRPFQQMEFLSVSLCMQTRQSYRHLGLRRATPFLPAVQIYRLSCGTEKMLKGDAWLAGYPL